MKYLTKREAKMVRDAAYRSLHYGHWGKSQANQNQNSEYVNLGYAQITLIERYIITMAGDSTVDISIHT